MICIILIILLGVFIGLRISEDEEQINFFKQYLVNDFFSAIEMDEGENEELNAEDLQEGYYDEGEEVYEETYDDFGEAGEIIDGGMFE